MRSICIIPARGGSKGIPGKNLIDFCGKPLVAWSIEQAQASASVTDVFVSSDDQDILDVATKYQAHAVNRPPELATDTIGAEETLIHALDYAQEQSDEPIARVVFLQPTSPLRAETDIDSAMQLFLKEEADSLFSAARFEDACIWKKEGLSMQSVTFDYQNRGRRQDREPLYLENGSIYIFKPSVLINHQNRLGGQIAVFEMPMWQSYEIDSPQDIEVCRYYMQTKILADKK